LTLLVRYAPNGGLSPLQTEMNRLFNTFFDTPTTGAASRSRRWIPAVDIVEADDRYVVKADLPGPAEDDVTIEVQDGVLTIRGERTSETSETREGHLRIERASGGFRRTLRLPEGVDAEQVVATFERASSRSASPSPRSASRAASRSGSASGPRPWRAPTPSSAQP
jgi:HSP20 family protein